MVVYCNLASTLRFIRVLTPVQFAEITEYFICSFLSFLFSLFLFISSKKVISMPLFLEQSSFHLIVYEDLNVLKLQT